MLRLVTASAIHWIVSKMLLHSCQLQMSRVMCTTRQYLVQLLNEDGPSFALWVLPGQAPWRNVSRGLLIALEMSRAVLIKGYKLPHDHELRSDQLGRFAASVCMDVSACKKTQNPQQAHADQDKSTTPLCCKSNRTVCFMFKSEKSIPVQKPLSVPKPEHEMHVSHRSTIRS